jgi:hypothetical protein
LSVNCNPSSLQQQARAFKQIPRGMLLPVTTLLLAKLAGGSLDPNVLAQQAKCFKCPPGFTPNEIKTALLCSLAGGVLPTPPAPPVTGCTDADANNFLTTIGNTNSTITNAVCALVQALKAAGVWTLMDAIYPFVGGTSASNSYNLKNPSQYRITWNGGVTFNSAGVTGDGSSGYGATGLFENTAGAQYTQNSAFWGMNVASWTTGYAMGALNSNGDGALLFLGGVTPDVVGPFSQGGQPNGSIPGFLSGRRINSTTVAEGSNGIDGSRSVTSQPGTQQIVLLALNNQGSVGFFSNATVSFACFGGTISAGQLASLYSAEHAFQTALSRN